jgi:hypothetical protein
MAAQTIKNVRFRKRRRAFKRVEFIKLWVEVFGLLAVSATFICYLWLGIMQAESISIAKKSFKLSHVPWIASDTRILPTKESPVLYLFYKNVGDTPAKIYFDYFIDDQNGQEIHGNIKPETVTWMPGQTYFETIGVNQTTSDLFVSGINDGSFKIRVVIYCEDIFGKKEILNETYLTLQGRWATESSSLVIPKEYIFK